MKVLDNTLCKSVQALGPFEVSSDRGNGEPVECRFGELGIVASILY